jgi:hypothetical protein
MSGMDCRAFGSPVAAATVATNACGSVGERVVRGSCIRLFQDARESIQRSTEVPGMGIVELLGPGGNVVGTGVLQDNIKCGMELNAVKLCPFEVGMRLAREPGAGSEEWGKRERGAGIVVKNPKMKKND